MPLSVDLPKVAVEPVSEPKCPMVMVPPGVVLVEVVEPAAPPEAPEFAAGLQPERASESDSEETAPHKKARREKIEFME